MIKVTNEIKIYEIDDQELKSISNAQPLIVKSHWNNDNVVVLEIGGVKYTVVAKDLKAAIDNATNIARF